MVSELDVDTRIPRIGFESLSHSAPLSDDGLVSILQRTPYFTNNILETVPKHG